MVSFEMGEMLGSLEDLLRHLEDSERQDPVLRPIGPEGAVARLGLAIPEDGIGLEGLCAKLEAIISETPKTSTSLFFNQLFGGRDSAGLLGDMLASALNNSMYTYKVAGPHVLIERVLVERMGHLMGYRSPGGVFSPGGSLSNLTALMLARNEAQEGVRASGFTGKVHRVYTSATSHYSIKKGAGLVGIGRENVIKIPVDSQGRMDPRALEAAIQSDRARGYVPAMVNATLGTTVEGAFDPIRPLAEICRNNRTWLHLDAAWGGSMVLCPEYRDLFDGSELADSITWDVHKMLGVPLTSSVLLTRREEVLTKHLNEDADYLFQQDTAMLNPGTRSLQCGRRNDVLKLWAAWQAHGDAGFAQRIRHLRSLVKSAVAVIKAHPDLTLTLDPASLNVCFRVREVDSATLCRRLLEQGRLMVGHATVQGEEIIRVIFVNPALTQKDVAHFFKEVLECASVG